MALPWRTISENVINISKVLNDLLDPVNDKDIMWVVRDQLGNVIEKKIPNISKLINVFGKRYIGAYEGTPSSRPDGAPLQPGDYYLDINDKKLKFFDGSGWLDTLPEVAAQINLDKYITETPKVSGPSKVYVGTVAEYNILNYDPKSIYYVFTSAGEAVLNNNKLLINLENISESTTIEIKLAAAKPGYLISDPVIFYLKAELVPEVSDQIINNDDPIVYMDGDNSVNFEYLTTSDNTDGMR